MNASATTISPAWSGTFAGTLRPLAAQIAVTGYLAGFSVLPNEWFHLGWLLLVGSVTFVWKENSVQQLRQPVNPGACLIAAFLLWMTLRSCFSEAFLQGQASGEVMRGMLGSLLLALFCALTWQMARDRDALSTTGWITGVLAGCAALISLMLTYFVLPGHMAGERLVNLLVHGGLNPICTGLIFGFSAVWLATLVEGKTLPMPRRLVWALIALLHLAAFFSGSRGVMLALACGHAALLRALGWRPSRRDDGGGHAARCPRGKDQGLERMRATPEARTSGKMGNVAWKGLWFEVCRRGHARPSGNKMTEQAPKPSIVDGGADALSQTKITMQRATCNDAGGLSPPVSRGILIHSFSASA